ncbi:MAG: YceI family protein [Candidatus Acidiferrum sp.]|jgi:polyisoprenoid-binding protein YceI
MLGALGGLGCALLLSASAPLPQAQTSKAAIPEIILTVNPAQSTVHWSVDSSLHLVHGTFALKSGALHFDSGTGRAGGEIVVSAISGESGNASRDARMHKEILESTKYPDLIFQPTQIDGHIAVSGASDAKLHGVFSIHGADHDLIAAVHAELTGNHWKGTTQFEVPYVRWGIKDPSNFLLKVKHVVSVELELSGEVKAPK